VLSKTFFARFPKQLDGCDHRRVQLPTSHDALLLITAFDLALKVVQIKLSESTGAQVFLFKYVSVDTAKI
jgi:hypothetical protein